MTTATPTPSLARTYRRLLGYLLRYRPALAVATIAMMISAAAEPLFAGLMKPLVDVNFIERDAAKIGYVPLLIIAVVIGRGVAGFISEYAMTWLSTRIVYDIRSELFEKLISMPSAIFDREQGGKLLSRFLYDSQQVTNAGASLLTIIIKDSLTLVGLLVYLFYTDWALTLICIGAVPPLYLAIRAAAKRLRKISFGLQAASGELTQVIEESIFNQKVIKVFLGHAYERKRFHNASNDVRKLAIKQTATTGLNSLLAEIVLGITLAAVIYIASFRATQGHLTAGAFISYVTAMVMLFGPMKRMSSINSALQRGLAAAESVFTMMDQPSEADTGTRDLPRARGALAMEQVTFRHDRAARPTLDNISLAAAPGEMIALVGLSGGGKTTLANLIPRFYEVDSGRITLDGTDIRELRLEELRRNIALVTQDVSLFNDTIAANIAYGSTAGTSRETIIAAAEAAHVMEFVRDMPEGLDTIVGDRGVRLSGGQKQRIAIARAILKDAPLLILDEATSALDNESEKIVQAALQKLMVGRTTFVIAHRLSTIQSANRIVVLDKGRIVEVGSHAELLALGGAYAKLHALHQNDPEALAPPTKGGDDTQEGAR